MYVFVYGILMRHATEGATLHGYRLGFSGFATVRPMPGAAVFGGLVEVDEIQLRRFDAVEGYPRYYGRRKVYVTTNEGRTVRAWVYVMNDEHFNEQPAPDRLVAEMEEQYERLGHTARAETEEGAIA